MDLFSIVSSSSGNCYIYKINNSYFLVDIGVSYRLLRQSLEQLEISISDIKAVFITHEHIDHVKGLRVFSKNNDINVYTKSKTYEALDYDFENYQSLGDKIIIDEITFDIFATSHDAADSFGIKISCMDKCHVHITDTGYLKQETLDFITGANSYLLESNYEDEMIMTNTRYPFMTKKRIMSNSGHLSNIQCFDYFNQIKSDKTKNLMLGHLSVNNNLPSIVETYYKDVAVNLTILKPSEIVKVRDVW